MENIYVRRKGKTIMIEKSKIDWTNEEDCWKAVRDNPFNLQYVRNQTLEMCLEAVRNAGTTLDQIHIQTLEICIEAIKEDPVAELYMRDSIKESKEFKLFMLEEKVKRL